MSYAPDYTPGTSFADDETNNVAGRSLVKTDRLDSELADISASINALNTNQKNLQRDDGKLADSLVEPYALAEQTRALIATNGSKPRGTWAPNTDYYFKEVVQRDNIAQMCLQDHRSGSTFTQSFWLPISGDGTSAANAAAAAASASAAATSQTSAAASATAAAGSATSASTSASNASISATNASNSASSASASATNAANSATESAASAASAAASAASINAPKNATNDPAFSSVSGSDAASPEWVKGIVFGFGQTLQDVSASRAFGTTYTNSTKKPITVYAGGTTTTSGACGITPTVDGVTLQGSTQQVTTGNYGIAVSFTVKPGGTYSISATNVSSLNWKEFR